MSKMEYMPVDCLQVPKMLFQMEKYSEDFIQLISRPFEICGTEWLGGS